MSVLRSVLIKLPFWFWLHLKLLYGSGPLAMVCRCPSIREQQYLACQWQDRRGPEPGAEKTSFPTVKGFVENNQECELLSASMNLVQTQLLTYHLTLAWHRGACSCSGLAVPCCVGEEEMVLPLGRRRRPSLAAASPCRYGGFPRAASSLAGVWSAEMSCSPWWFPKRFLFQPGGSC